MFILLANEVTVFLLKKNKNFDSRQVPLINLKIVKGNSQV